MKNRSDNFVRPVLFTHNESCYRSLELTCNLKRAHLFRERVCERLDFAIGIDRSTTSRCGSVNQLQKW